jgi:hypothetical protein
LKLKSSSTSSVTVPFSAPFGDNAIGIRVRRTSKIAVP